MHDQLLAYLNQLLKTELSAGEVEAVKTAFVPKKLRRNQYLLQEGEVCKTAGFVVRGALKQFSVDETGRENVLVLCVENWWAGDRESFTTNTPSDYYIQAVEPTEMLLVSKENYLNILSKQPFISDLTRVLSERQSQQLLKRVHATKTLSAEQRLADLEKNYPELLQRFPQHLIASYLGMTKETLSRIRALSLKK